MSKDLIAELKSQLRRSWSWGVEDFRRVAESTDNPHDYDPEKYEEGIHQMIQHHSPTLGVTYEVIRYYLDKYCLKETPNE